MKIILISPHGSLIAHGLRQIGACLQKAGHSICMIFLPLPEEIELLPGAEIKNHYHPGLMDDIAEICRGADIIGMSCSTYHFRRLAMLSDYLRHKINARIVWGGIHATVSFEECLQHADWVCRGEGEIAMQELAEDIEEGGNGHDIANICYRSEESGKIMANPLRPLIQDIDDLPYPLYEHKGHYILHGKKLAELTPELACWHLSDGYSFGNGSAYHVWATRGCPHHCTYCCNSFYLSIYPQWNIVRRHGNQRIIEEICYMRDKMPFIDRVAFMDDTFFAASNDVITEFSKLYKKKVDLPFFACASPATLNKQHLDLMVSAGLRYIWIGMQSGSTRMQRFYRRNNDINCLQKTSVLLEEYKGKIRPPVFDFIIDPTFQEPEDQRLTLELIKKLKYPFQLALYSMTFFPGTEITRIALEKGFKAISAEEKNILSLERNFYRAALWAYGRNLPKKWLNVLSRPLVYRVLSGWCISWLWRLFGAWLERRERKQLIKWTVRHRREVIEKNFPGMDWEELAAAPFNVK